MHSEHDLLSWVVYYMYTGFFPTALQKRSGSKWYEGLEKCTSPSRRKLYRHNNTLSYINIIVGSMCVCMCVCVIKYNIKMSESYVPYNTWGYFLLGDGFNLFFIQLFFFFFFKLRIRPWACMEFKMLYNQQIIISR